MTEYRKRGELVEVGDTIIAQNLGTHTYPITRVTKTMAVSKRPSDGYESKFQRKVQFDMRRPSEKWSTTRYRVIKREE